MDLSLEIMKEFFDNQFQTWPLANKNYETLKNVEEKEFQFNGFAIKVQYNPARIQSSAAKTDPTSILTRKCFLCPQNLPPEQKDMSYNEDYHIMVNPFPIFPIHFTVPTYKHTEQLIYGRYGDMLDLAKKLTSFIILYNGPKSGASAPDHFHFQAGIKGFLPIERDVLSIPKEIVYEVENLKVYSIKNNLRNSFLLDGNDKDSITLFFNRLYSLLELKPEDKEPMMNVFTWYESEKWVSVIAPREKHRPSFFYLENDENILTSPGAVDIGGTLILPLEKDFRKITSNDIENIFREVCISGEKIQVIIDKIKLNGT